MDWISKLPAWLAALALVAIAGAFGHVLIVKPDRFEFAGLAFGFTPELDLRAKNAVMAFDRAAKRRGEECPDGWTLFEPAVGRMVLGAGSRADEGASRAYRPAYSEEPDEAVGGEEKHELTPDEMPEHRHGLSRIDRKMAHGEDRTHNYANIGNYDSNLETDQSGGSLPHNNMPPYIALYLCKKEL